MCGIAGCVTNKNISSRRQQVEKMLNKINHRGPDNKNISWSLNFCGGYVRLAINDIKFGNQPFTFENQDDKVYS